MSRLAANGAFVAAMAGAEPHRADGMVMTPPTLRALDDALTCYAQQRLRHGHTEGDDASRSVSLLGARTASEAIAAQDYLRRNTRDAARHALARTIGLAIATMVRLEQEPAAADRDGAPGLQP